MGKEKSKLYVGRSDPKKTSARTWEDIKRELEIYWNSCPRYRGNGSAKSRQFEELPYKQAGE